jgi:PAS domain S-box-containing protein
MDNVISNRYIVAKFLWLRSLKTRITLFTLLIFVLGLWSLSFYASQELRDDMQRMLGEQQLATVSFVGSEINDELSDRLKILEKVAATIGPALLGNPADLQAMLEQRLILQGPFNAGVIATRMDGIALADVPITAKRMGVNYVDRDHITTALRQGKAMIGRPVMGKKAMAPILGMAVPIRDAQGQVIGALAGVTDLSQPNFLDKITASRYGKSGGYLLVAPQHRLIVTATEKRRIMEVLPAPGLNPGMDRRNEEGYEGTQIFVNPRGVEVLNSAKTIPVASWYLVALLPTEEAFAPIRAMQWRMLLATLVLTLLAGALTWWMIKRQLAPMLVAVHALGIQAKTDQPLQALPVTGQDEIGELVAGFNHLLESLRQRGELLQESELRYRTMADFTSDWEYWLLPDGTLRYVSPSCEQISGYTASEFYADPQLLTRIIHPDDALLWAEHTHHINANGISEPIDCRIRTKDGAHIWISHVCRPVLDAVGQALGLRGSNRDVTQRKKAEAELQRVHDDLQRFAEVTAHHLQEPARRLASYAARLTQQLGHRLDDDEARLSLEFISEQALRMKRMLGDVERYLAADQARGPITNTDAGAVVASILERLSSRLAQTGTQVSVGELPAAWIDAPRLSDLFEMVLDNALQHGSAEKSLLVANRPHFPLQITIEGKCEAALVRYRISDNGPGIEEPYRERVFRVFERLNSHGEGSGIGLAIVRRIAESCGGYAYVEPAQGGGCCVVFELRLKPG